MARSLLYIVLPPSLSEKKKKKKKKPCQSWTPSGKTFGSAHVNVPVKLRKNIDVDVVRSGKIKCKLGGATNILWTKI